MKKSFILLCFLLLTSANLFATYSIDWVKPADSYLKTGAMIVRDKSNNVIVTGYTANSSIYTRKYDKFGNFQWEKTTSSGIQSNYEKSKWVNADKNKNIYVTGYRYTIGSNWEFPNSIIVIKYNSAGTLQWKQVIPLSYVVGSSSGFSFNMKTEIDYNSGSIYIGTAGTSPAGFVMIKLNSSGTVLANSNYYISGTHGFGSVRLKGNKVIVVGRSYISNYNAAVVAWDTLGNFLWTKTLTGVFANDIEIDAGGNSYVLTSYPNLVSPTSGYDIVIHKLNASGAQVYQKNYDFGGQEFASKFTLVSGRISVIGYGTLSPSLYTDWITFQINTAGTQLWNNRYNGTNGNDERPYFLSAKANGDVFVTGIGGPTPVAGQLSWLRMVTLKYNHIGGTQQWIDTVNINGGTGLACTLASDSSLFVLSQSNMTAYHFLDHNGTGSCGVPINLNALSITDTSAVFSWSPVAGAYLYHLRYKTSTSLSWNVVSTNLTSKTIKEFTQGTSYDFAVEAVCNNGPSGFSASQTFTTTGSGYCSSVGQSTAQEFLDLVWIGSIQNSTGSNNGYGDFTNLNTNLILGSSVSGYLRGTLGGAFTEYYSVWIDYNHDADFADAGELVASISSSSIGYNVITFNVPSAIATGVTRLRVTMQYGSAPLSCGSFPRGETEDYTVTIVTPKIENDFEDYSKDDYQYQIFPNPFTDKIYVQSKNNDAAALISIYDLSGKLLLNFAATDSENEYDLSSLSSGIYFCRIKTNENFKTFKLIKK